MASQWEYRTTSDGEWLPFTLFHLHRFDVEFREPIAKLMAAGPPGFELRDKDGGLLEVRQVSDG